MPFRGELDGEPVLPHDAGPGDAVECPDCGERMTVVKSHPRGDALVARHFRHGGAGGCGESDEHLFMKHAAASALLSVWPGADVAVEADVPGADRRADVVAFFGADRSPLGKGLAVEVQYRNDSKDMEAAARNYGSAGFSCLELGTDAFSGYSVSLSSGGLTTRSPVASAEEPGALMSKLRWLSAGESIEVAELRDRLGWSDEWMSYVLETSALVPNGSAVVKDGVIEVIE